MESAGRVQQPRERARPRQRDPRTDLVLAALPHASDAAHDDGRAGMTCSHCFHWKRREADLGVCWQRLAEYPAPEAHTRAEATCQEWTPKVWRVTKE